MCYLVDEKVTHTIFIKNTLIANSQKKHMEVAHGFNTDALANRSRLFREL